MSSQQPGRRGQRQVKYTASGIAFVVGFAVLVLLMWPSLWGLAAGAVVGSASAAAVYGTLYGRELKAERGHEIASTQQSLAEQLSEIEATIRARESELPPATRGQLRMMTVGLDEIVQRWETLARAPEQQDAVVQTIRRHLPRTLEMFLELPNTSKPEYAEEFKAQIQLMAEAVAKTRDHVVGRDLQALRRNRLLLEETLTDPDEQLFRREGL